jgi:acylphosphatase
VAGWVRNLPDGSVEAEAEAEAPALEAFVSELRSGLPFARVREIVRTEVRPIGEVHFVIH